MMAPERDACAPGAVLPSPWHPARFAKLAQKKPVAVVGKLGSKPSVVNVLLPTGRLASDFSTLVPAD